MCSEVCVGQCNAVCSVACNSCQVMRVTSRGRAETGLGALLLLGGEYHRPTRVKTGVKLLCFCKSLVLLRVNIIVLLV